MATNEETIVMNGEEQEVNQSKTSKGWQKVVIGGVTGVMLGAGTAYAASKLIDGDEPTEGGNHAGTKAGTHDVSVDSSDVATVKQGMTFAEAFEDARAQVGPGGVFRWHDGVYGTYLKDEWDAMSPEEQQQFTKNAINAAKGVGNGSAVYVSTEDVHDDANMENDSTPTAYVEPHVAEPTSETTTETAPEPTFAVNNNLNVHVVGAHDEQLAYTVGLQKGEGVENDVFVVNLEDDNACSVETSELYNCCQTEENEITGLSTKEVDESNAEMNMYTSNDTTSEMPDCMNDLDVQLI